MEPFATVEDYRIRYPADATVSSERIEAALADAQDMIEVEADDLTDVQPLPGVGHGRAWVAATHRRAVLGDGATR